MQELESVPVDFLKRMAFPCAAVAAAELYVRGAFALIPHIRPMALRLSIPFENGFSGLQIAQRARNAFG